MIAAARAAREVCRRSRVPFLVNDRVDVAIAVDADGVHLGTDDLPLPLARRLLGPHRLIGASAGSVEEALGGLAPGGGLPRLRTGLRNRNQVGRRPTLRDGPPLAGRARRPDPGRRDRRDRPLQSGGGPRAGAHGAAVISSVCAAPDPEEATRTLRGIIDAYFRNAAGKSE